MEASTSGTDQNASASSNDRPTFHGQLLTELMGGLQVKATASMAAEDLRRYAPIHGTQMLAATELLQLLGKVIAEGTGEPAACSAMWVLAQLTLQPGGRARVRDHCGVISPIVRYLTGAQAAALNVEPATLVLSNLSADRAGRAAIRKAGGVQALIGLVLQMPQGRVADFVAGALVNLTLVEDSDARTTFVGAGGIEAAVKMLHVRGRTDSSVCGRRLRLLLADLAINPQYDAQVRQLATGAHSLPESLDPTPRTADDAAADAAAGSGEAYRLTVEVA